MLFIKFTASAKDTIVPASRALRPLGLLVLSAIVVFGACAAWIGPLRWRAILLLDKATGRLNDLDWSEMRWVLGRKNGVDLKRLAETRNAYIAIENPLKSKSDVEAGGLLFQRNCQICHGEAGRGGAGPNLYDRAYHQGRSDWALFRTITRGIPGTAMAGWPFSREDVWRLVAYLQETIVNARHDADGAKPVSIRPVTPNEVQLAAENPAEWLTYSGSYSGQRHSKLQQINRSNVWQLHVAWVRQFASAAERVETTPIVRGSVMFVTVPPNQVMALDATTGSVLWAHSWDLPPKLKLCCGQVNRGVAILGERVFVGTLDGRLMALDANSGKELWQAAVADNTQGYSITGAPLAIDNMVLTGVGGGEFGIRGFIDAYDASSGKRLWRTYTVPAPGEPGSETWQGESLLHGGAPTWLTGSYDPETRTVFWGVGNPSPNYNGENRKGDNLYANSVVALDLDSGKMRWHFQFTPHDTHDWDSVQIPVLIDAKFDGKPRKLMAWANRNGFYYLLDRTDGKFLLGMPFVKQTWADGLDPNGRPRVRPESIPSREGSLVYPSLEGGTNWWSPSYDPDSRVMYIPTIDLGGIFYLTPHQPATPEGFLLGGMDVKVPNEDMTVAVKAIDVQTGRIRWEAKQPPRRTVIETAGLLSTAGHLVFGGDLDTFYASDTETGRELWKCTLGAQIAAAPITYQLDGRQYIAVAAGRSIFAFALPLMQKTQAAGR
jgi:alcohol dehydrogenase (cytochrome c)